MKIVETQAEIDGNAHGEVYVRAENILVWQGADSIRVTDLTHALATGKECREVSIRNWTVAERSTTFKAVIVNSLTSTRQTRKTGVLRYMPAQSQGSGRFHLSLWTGSSR